MTPEQEKQLREVLELSKENNEILKKMRRSMIWNRVIKVFYLLIILGVTFGSYYLIQPYLDSVLGAYQGVIGTPGETQGMGNNLPNFLNFLQLFGISI